MRSHDDATGALPCLLCSARQISACAVLGDDDLRSLAALAHTVHFAPRETLFAQGRPAEAVHAVSSGMVRLYKLLPDGRRQIVGFAMSGDILGVTMRATFDISADAIDAVTTCMFSRASYSAFVDETPHLLRRMHDLVGDELALAREQMMLLGRRTAEERVVCFLIAMKGRWTRRGRPSVTVPLPMSRQDIADFLGLTIETVSRTLTRLVRDKTILIVPDGVRLLNAARMMQIAAA